MSSISAASSYIRGFSVCGGFLCAEPHPFNLYSESDVCQHHKTFFLKISEMRLSHFPGQPAPKVVKGLVFSLTVQG